MPEDMLVPKDYVCDLVSAFSHLDTRVFVINRAVFVIILRKHRACHLPRNPYCIPTHQSVVYKLWKTPQKNKIKAQEEFQM